MTFRFDDDLALERLDAHTFRASISRNWNIGDIPNGGYLMAVAARALSQALPHPDPFSITAHFFRPVACREVDIRVIPLKSGKKLTYADATLCQDGEDCLRVTAAFGDLDRRDGLDHIAGSPPRVPRLEDCVHADIGFRIFKNLDIRLAPETAAWLHGQYDDTCELTGWVSFADYREPDVLSLALFADAFPPPVLRQIGPVGWVPTIEMTTHIRQRPAPGPLRCRFVTRFISGGYAEEDGEIWDAEDQLVARSRQLALVRLPDGRNKPA